MHKITSLKLATLVFSLFAASFSQSIAQKRLDIGLMVGPEFNHIHFTKKIDSDISSSPMLGFIVDGHLQLNLTSHLSIDIGIGYANKRFKQTQSDLIFSSSINDNGTFEYSQVEVWASNHVAQAPVMLKYYFGKADMRFFAGLGGNSMLTFHRSTKGLITHPNGNTEDLEWSEGTSFFDFSAQAAFGVMKPLDERHRLNVELYSNVFPLSYEHRLIYMITTGLRIGIWI